MPAPTIESLRQIERLCTRFEELRDPTCNALQAVIDPLLADCDLDRRNDLLRELIAIDVELLHRDGQPVSLSRYRPILDREDIRLSQRDLEAIVRGEPNVDTAVPQSHRYRFLERIGRGGNGEVWRVEDRVSRRPLALKLLRCALANTPAATERMNREALLTGCLQHPGIPPIYDHGVLDDGRPYFTMKLVGGDTFADILGGGRSDEADLSRCLGIFEQLCQTVAYAHSRKVIHRDLKPANVMVGAFGEVQVMDWGMAKPLAERVSHVTTEATNEVAPPDRSAVGVADDTKPATSDESWDDLHPSLTAEGDVMGTPAYMSPEQARGETKRLDTRSDVFTLGAILFEVLTRQRLHEGCSSVESLRRTATDDLRSSLNVLGRSDAHDELKTLCRRCLANDPADRPADAGVVNDTVASHLSGVERRVRQAEIERREASVRAEEDRKRRRLQTNAALAVASISILATGIAFWQRSVAIDAGRQTAAALALADQRFDEAQDVVDEFLTRVADDEGVLTRTPGAQAIRRDLMQKAVDYYEELDTESKQTPEFRFKIAQTHLHLAEVMYLLAPGGDKLVEHADRAVEMCDRLIDEFPDRIEYLACQADAASLNAKALIETRRYGLAIPAATRAEALAKKLVQARGTGDDRFQLAQCIANVAGSRERHKKLEGCQERFEKAIAIATPIQAANPTRADYALGLANMHNGLAIFFGWRRGQWKETRKHFEQAVQLLQLAVDLKPSRSEVRNRLATQHMNLAMSLTHVGETKQAEASFRRAIETHERIVRENPLDVIARYDLANAMSNFATFCLRNLNRPKETASLLGRAAEQADHLLEIEPDVERHLTALVDMVHSLADSKLRVAIAESGSGPKPLASEVVRPELNLILRHCRRWVSDNPDSDKYRRLVSFWSALLPETDPRSILKMTEQVTIDSPTFEKLDVDWIHARAVALLRDGRHVDAIALLQQRQTDDPTPERLLIESLAHSESDPEKSQAFLDRARAHKFKKMETRVAFHLLMENVVATLGTD